MATYQKITSLLFKPQGVHNASVDYSVMDVVTSPDKSRVYFAVQNVPAGIALTNEEYWQLQIDLSSSKSAMDEALASFGSYAKEIGMRVKGETANASGNPVTCLADAGSLLQPVTVLEPKQEGSGDPYPAGGGRNLCSLGTVEFTQTYNAKIGTTLAPGTYTLSANASSNDTDSDTCLFIVRSDEGGTELARGFLYRGKVESRTFTISSEAKAIILYASNGHSAGAGDVCTWKDIQIEAGSAATAFMPYSNIRPFIGYDVLGLNHAGKNLYDKNNPNIIKGWFNAEGGTIGSSSTQNTIYIPCSPNTTYTVSKILGGNRFRIAYTKEKPNLGTTVYAYVGGPDNSTALKITTGRDAKYLVVWAWTSDGSTVTWDELNASIQIEIGSTASTFEPYQGKPHTVQIGQTVYGIRYEWLTGKGWIEWAGTALTGNETVEKYTNATSGNGVTISAVLPESMYRADGFCSHALVDNVLSVPNIVMLGNSNRTVYWTSILDTLGFSTASEFKTWVTAQNSAGTPVQFVWKLTTPIEIQLTPHIISATDPEQTNTLYGDGRIDVEYVKPLHVSIEERVAAAVAAAMQTE